MTASFQHNAQGVVTTRAIGKLLLRGARSIEPRAHYRKALELAEPRGMRPLVAHCHRGLGKLYQRTGERRKAQEHLAVATTMYRDMDMRFWLGKTG